MNVYKIKSDVLRKQGKRIEGSDKSRMEQRLAVVQKHDPKAKLLIVPAAR
jgi:hypothetical protein